LIAKQKEITDILNKRDIRPSYIRIRVYDYLYRDKVHPNVDTIYKNLSEEIPTLSKTTVYNTLKLLTDKDLVRAININDNEMRYEAIRNDHGHFKCDKCKTIYDIPMDMNIKLPKEMKGSRIDERQFLVSGVCNNCNQ